MRALLAVLLLGVTPVLIAAPSLAALPAQGPGAGPLPTSTFASCSGV